MPNILLNGLGLGKEFSGVQYYTENLARTFQGLQSLTEIDLLVPVDYEGLVQTGQRLRLIRSGVNSTSRICRVMYENLISFKLLQQYKIALYHSPNYILPYVLPVPGIVTIHDLISIEHPEFATNASVAYHHLLQKRTINMASKVIAVSNIVKQDILRCYNVSESKIVVIYHGINPLLSIYPSQGAMDLVKHKYLLPERYILFVGNIEPKKNLVRLLEAFANLKRNTEFPHKLVIVGKNGWKYDNVFESLKLLHLEQEVMFTGYVDESHLSSIYRLADLFVFPSLYEGFGIPPLEAMACGIPVLISNKGALPEVTGNLTMQVDPLNTNAIARNIAKLLSDQGLRKRSIEQGYSWAQQFTWAKTASQTNSVYEQTLQCTQNQVLT